MALVLVLFMRGDLIQYIQTPSKSQKKWAELQLYRLKSTAGRVRIQRGGFCGKVYEGQSCERSPEAWILEFLESLPTSAGNWKSVIQCSDPLAPSRHSISCRQQSLELGSCPCITYTYFILWIDFHFIYLFIYFEIGISYSILPWPGRDFAG